MTASSLRSYTYDSSLVLKATGLIAASAAVATIVAVGEATFKGVAVIDVTAIEVASTDEEYVIIVQGSTSSTFASGVENLAALPLGAAAARLGAATVGSTAGRYELPFLNEQNGTVYPYLRLYTVVAGSIATGINYSAYIGRDFLNA